MTTPCSLRTFAAPPSRPPDVLRLSATSGTRLHTPGSTAARTSALRIVAPGRMFTPPAASSSSPRRTTYSPEAPSGAIISSRPKTSLPKSKTTLPALFVVTEAGRTVRSTVASSSSGSPGRADTDAASRIKYAATYLSIFISRNLVVGDSQSAGCNYRKCMATSRATFTSRLQSPHGGTRTWRACRRRARAARRAARRSRPGQRPTGRPSPLRRRQKAIHP